MGTFFFFLPRCDDAELQRVVELIGIEPMTSTMPL
jgi:hypothetical protein